MKQIPDAIFEAAEKHGGIPLDFYEDADALTIVMTDGRKITEEKPTGTKKRIQRAEAEQAEKQAAEAINTYNKAAEAAQTALESMIRAKEKAEALRAIADGGISAPPAASTPPPTESGSLRSTAKKNK